MSSLHLPPLRHLRGALQIPGSKSIFNRALLLAALAQGETRIDNLLDSEDTQRLRAALAQLGVALRQDGEAMVVTGCAGPLSRQAVSMTLDLGLAGTAYRPLTAALTLGKGAFVLDGVPRMRERPIGPLVDGLRQLAAQIEYLGEPGFPPLRVTGNGLRGGRVTLDGSVSSQFLTALLMAAPLADNPITINITSFTISKPYLTIKLHLIQQFGITIQHKNFQHFHIPKKYYHNPKTLTIKDNTSSTSYFLAAGAIAGPGLTVRGVGSNSVQGDMALVDVLRDMGAKVQVQPTSVTVKPGPLRGIDRDLNALPDAAMTVATLALFAQGVTTIRNIASWRVKETDRLSAMATQLRKVGAGVDEGDDFIAITPPPALQPAAIDTYGDHRMAMCFSLVALGGAAVTINDPRCVDKTFPTFFDVFESMAVRA